MLSTRSVLNAILYVAEQECTWRGLPAHFGTWHTLSTRMNRWAKKGVLDRVFAELQRLEIMRVKVEVLSLDSTVVKVHPDGTGALEKHGAQALGKSRGGWTTKLHRVAAKDRNAVGFSWSGGQEGDGPQGRTLLHRMVLPDTARCLVMDKAYEGDETRKLVASRGLEPVVPPKANRITPWEYDRELYLLSIYSPPPTDDESFFLTGSDPAWFRAPFPRSRPRTGCTGFG